MTTSASPLSELRRKLQDGSLNPVSVATDALAHANSNAGRNVYLTLDAQRTIAEAESLSERFPNPDSWPPLFGVPVSVKDCFDVAGVNTSCASRYYARESGVAARDSDIVRRLRNAGAVVIGKTHLHQLAYGITGENRDYGDCLQPRDRNRLTGGSSSGAAASIQEQSALVAIGTDTGGSIRVPAALCGTAGYRSSLGLGSWDGAVHLAPSFDSLGWLFGDLRDAPLLAEALLDIPAAHDVTASVTIGAVSNDFLHDCDPSVASTFESWKHRLIRQGATIHSIQTDFWADAVEIFAGIQAHEAAAIHKGHFDEFETPIAARLAWGASIAFKEMESLRARHRHFRKQMDSLFEDYDFLIVPCAPVDRLTAGEDHTLARNALLRYLTPMSLTGAPVVALPGVHGGVQLAAARGSDARLLAYAALLG